MLAKEPLEWNGEQLSEDLFEAQFRLHPFQGIIADAELGDDMAEIIAQHFGAQNAAFCNNLVSVDTLISHKPFTAPRGQAYYFKWLGHTRQRYSPCASWAEYHAVIARD